MLLLCFIFFGLTFAYVWIWETYSKPITRLAKSPTPFPIPLIYTYSNTPIKTDEAAAVPSLGLSVVVPCRNEADRIGPLLQTLAYQTMPASRWEVLFIDDESTDGTAAVIRNWIKACPWLNARLIAGPGPGGKKAALAAGIAAAHHPLILTTDADCWAGSGWLAEMAVPFANPSVQFAIGLVVYESDGSLLHDIQQAESLGLVTLGAGAALKGKPFLANGANFAFRRSAFDAVGGYRHGGHLASGDDTFLVEAFSNSGFECACVWSAQALVWTRPAVSWRAYWQQNVRWLSKARASKNRRQRSIQLLGLLVWGSWWPLALGLGILECGPKEIKLFACATLLRMIADSVNTLPLLRLAELRRPLTNWLLGQLVYAVWVPWVAVRSLAGGSYVWRGRRLR